MTSLSLQVKTAVPLGMGIASLAGSAALGGVFLGMNRTDLKVLNSSQLVSSQLQFSRAVLHCSSCSELREEYGTSSVSSTCRKLPKVHPDTKFAKINLIYLRNTTSDIKLGC